MDRVQRSNQWQDSQDSYQQGARVQMDTPLDLAEPPAKFRLSPVPNILARVLGGYAAEADAVLRARGSLLRRLLLPTLGDRIPGSQPQRLPKKCVNRLPIRRPEGNVHPIARHRRSPVSGRLQTEYETFVTIHSATRLNPRTRPEASGYP